jgi:hypothetical protein
MASIKNIGQEDICYKIYDPVEKKLIVTYNTCRETSDKLGLSQSVVRYAALNKTRRFSPILKKKIAIRYSKREK